MAQVYSQLAEWHRRVTDGTHYSGEDDGPSNVLSVIPDEAAAYTAARFLGYAAEGVREAAVELRLTHSANGRVRWFDEISTVDRAILATAEMENHNGEEVN